MAASDGDAGTADRGMESAVSARSAGGGADFKSAADCKSAPQGSQSLLVLLGDQEGDVIGLRRDLSEFLNSFQ